MSEQKSKEAVYDFDPSWHQYSEHDSATDTLTEILERKGLDRTVMPPCTFISCRIETKYLPRSRRVIAQRIESFMEPNGSIGTQKTTEYCRHALNNNPLRSIEICESPYNLNEGESKETLTYFNPKSKGHVVAHESKYYDVAAKTIIRTLPLTILHARGYRNYLNYLSTLQQAI